MPTNYTGDATGLALTDPIIIPVVADGDDVTALFTTPSPKKLADFVKLLRDKTELAPKSWGIITTDGTGGVTLVTSKGAPISGVSIVGAVVRITFTTAFNLPYCPQFTVADINTGVGADANYSAELYAPTSTATLIDVVRKPFAGSGGGFQSVACKFFFAISAPS